jgi:hypothetical protein
MPYALSIGSFATEVYLANDYTASASATDAGTGTDNKGTAKAHELKITPISTGSEAAGNYTGIITVIVSYN